MLPYTIEAGTGQHIGDRPEQQDQVALFASSRAPGYMMAVLADGMGGASGGVLASEQVIRTARQIFEAFSPLTEDVPSMLQSIAHEIHTVIQLMTLSSEHRPQSTVVMLVVTPDHTAFWGHAGDSRLYRFSGPNLAERTLDHADIVTAKPTTARPEIRQARILRNVLGNPSIEPTLSIGRHDGLKAGDAFLLCSDGLWQYFTDAELGVAVAMSTPREASELLIRKARDRATDGTGDNCSLAVVKLVAQAKKEQHYKVGKMRRAV